MFFLLIVDLLGGPRDVVLWLGESGLCQKEDLKNSVPAKQLIDVARAYRDLLRRGIEAYVQKQPLPRGLFQNTNILISRNVCVRQLVKDDKGYRVEKRWQLDAAEDYLVPVAESFTKLVTEACLNTSKGGQRSWCSLDICGNKLRMAASWQKNHV